MNWDDVEDTFELFVKIAALAISIPLGWYIGYYVLAPFFINFISWLFH